MQQMLDFEKVNSRDESPCLEMNAYNSRNKVCTNNHSGKNKEKTFSKNWRVYFVESFGGFFSFCKKNTPSQNKHFDLQQVCTKLCRVVDNSVKVSCRKFFLKAQKEQKMHFLAK